MTALSEAEFDKLADATLHDLTETLADSGEELEADLESGVLTIAFDDRTRYVVNSHRAARQIWMSAEASAWHFDWSNSQWISTKTREELWSVLGALLTRRLGKTVSLPRST